MSPKVLTATRKRVLDICILLDGDENIARLDATVQVAYSDSTERREVVELLGELMPQERGRFTALVNRLLVKLQRDYVS